MSTVIGPVASATISQICTTTLTTLLSQYFANTLGKETDIVKLMLAQIYYESHFNTLRPGPQLNPINSSGAADYINASAVQNVMSRGYGTAQYVNIQQGLSAWGLMQSMGWNHVIGGSQKLGKCLIEIARPDLVSLLCVQPGDSIKDKLSGPNTISNQILAGLTVLESKYKSVKAGSGGYVVGPYVYPSKMQAAFRGYIGLATNDKGNGSSAAAYVNSVYYGSAFTAANGPGGPGSQNPTAVAGASGPTITVASGDNQHPYGC